MQVLTEVVEPNEDNVQRCGHVGPAPCGDYWTKTTLVRFSHFRFDFLLERGDFTFIRHN